jgi:hypothetical protein
MIGKGRRKALPLCKAIIVGTMGMAEGTTPEVICKVAKIFI